MNYTNIKQQHFATFDQIVNDLQETIDRSRRKVTLKKFGLENHSFLKSARTLINKVVNLNGNKNQLAFARRGLPLESERRSGAKFLGARGILARLTRRT